VLLALGAVMAGARFYALIATAVAERAVAVCGRSPHASMIRRLLGRLDVAALEAALAGWVLTRRDAVARAAGRGGPLAERRCVLAVDGKTLRAARAARR
jgi:hypothetical protein